MSRPREFNEQAVIDAAMQAFWEGGLVATSVDDLLHATGLSRSSMYQCIGNRDAFLERAVERYVDQQVAEIRELFRGLGVHDALKRLLLDAALRNFEGRGCLLVNGINELHVAEAGQADMVRAGFARLAEELRAAIARCAPQRTDAAQLGAAVMAAIAGLRTMHRAGIPKRLLRDAALRFADMLAKD